MRSLIFVKYEEGGRGMVVVNKGGSRFSWGEPLEKY